MWRVRVHRGESFILNIVIWLIVIFIVVGRVKLISHETVVESWIILLLMPMPALEWHCMNSFYVALLLLTASVLGPWEFMVSDKLFIWYVEYCLLCDLFGLEHSHNSYGLDVNSVTAKIWTFMFGFSYYVRASWLVQWMNSNLSVLCGPQWQQCNARAILRPISSELHK